MSQELKINIKPIEAQVETLIINDQESMALATTLLSNANKYLDIVVEYKEKKTKPLNEALKVIRAETKPLETKLEAIVETIRGSMSTYQTNLINTRLASESAISARVGEGRGHLKIATAVAKIEALPEVLNKTSTEAGSISFMEVQDFEVMDITLLPIEYHLANEVKIRADIKRDIKVAGVRYFTKQVPRNIR